MGVEFERQDGTVPAEQQVGVGVGVGVGLGVLRFDRRVYEC